MNIPRYWAKIDVAAWTFRGQQVHFSCWRWSDHSLDSARALAREAARRIRARIEGAAKRPERYAYGTRPLREEIIEEFRGRDGMVSAVVSRNAFGCLVLNTARVMFVDIDLPKPPRWPRLVQRALALIRRTELPSADPEGDALRRIDEWMKLHPKFGFRIYRTRAGFRLLATHDLFEPDLPTTEQLMQELGCDPLYIKLCHAQQSFRARLSPKPWRIDQPRPAKRYPFEDDAAQGVFDAWLQEYRMACEKFSTCTYLKTVGAVRVHPDVEPMIRIHDQHCKVTTNLPLA